jgi:DNA-binding beta-propeller fold protein YncE
MPPLPLAAALHRELPWVSDRTRTILTALAASGGDVGSVEHLAALAAFRNRFQLARWVRREGLPPAGDLIAWARVLHWAYEAETSGTSLSDLALRSGVDPATAYRIVKRASGSRWTVLRRSGFSKVLSRFGASCHPVATLPHPRSHKHRDTTVPVAEPATASCPRCTPPPVARRAPPQVYAKIPVPGQPFDVACWSTDRAYVTCGHHGVIRVLDLLRQRTTATVPVGSVPTRIVIGRGERLAYVSNQFDRTIAIIDIGRQRLVREIAVRGDPVPLMLDPVHEVLHVATNEDCLLAIDLRSGTPIDAMALPATSHHLALHPSGRRLYVATRAAGAVLEIGLRPYTLARRWLLGGQPQAMAVRQDGTRLFVANEVSGLDVIDLALGQPLSGMYAGYGGCFGVVLSPSQREVYATSPATGVLRVADASSLRCVATIPLGGTPRQMTFDPTGRFLLVTNEAGWVDIVTQADQWTTVTNPLSLGMRAIAPC